LVANDADDRRYNDRHVCRHFSGGQKYYQPRNCFHCAEPPCLTAAIVKRPDGIVDIVQDLCTGCGNCVPACPYDAIEMNIVAPILPPGLENGHGAADVAPRVAGVVEKCSFCVHRIDADLAPACVAAI
jgi:Fe-S-cluster-containing dehydrogenase component